MNYHIFDTHTLKSMAKDINKEINKLTDNLNRLHEEKNIIDFIIDHRDSKTNSSLVHPLKHLSENDNQT